MDSEEDDIFGFEEIKKKYKIKSDAVETLSPAPTKNDSFSSVQYSGLGITSSGTSSLGCHSV